MWIIEARQEDGGHWFCMPCSYNTLSTAHDEAEALRRMIPGYEYRVSKSYRSAVL